MYHLIVPTPVVHAFVALVTVPWVMLGPGAADAPSAGPPLAAPAPGCASPAQVLDLTNWKIQLPVAKPDGAKGPLEIKQPELASYAQAPWFVPSPACDAVVFRAPVNGVTTTGSHNPRSELREMTDNGSANAGWSSTAGQHRMTVTEAFLRLPDGKPDLVGAQIHDATHDISVFRLEGSNLYVTHDNDPHHKLVTDHYVLGTPFEARYEVSGGEVRAFYNGALQTTISDHFRGGYFKAGAYPQANCADAAPCSADNYGATALYQISVFHQVTTWDLVWDWITTWVPIGLAAVALLALVYVVVRRMRGRPLAWTRRS